MLVSAFFRHHRIPGNVLELRLELFAAGIEEADTVFCNDGDLVLMSGFGAGMTWASALLQWGKP